MALTKPHAAAKGNLLAAAELNNRFIGTLRSLAVSSNGGKRRNSLTATRRGERPLSTLPSRLVQSTAESSFRGGIHAALSGGDDIYGRVYPETAQFTHCVGSVPAQSFELGSAGVIAVRAARWVINVTGAHSTIRTAPRTTKLRPAPQ